MSEQATMAARGTEGIHAQSKLRDMRYVMSGHHCHSYYELFYLETGRCRFLINESIHDLQAGDFILIPPFALHYTRYLFGACRRTIVMFRRQDVSEETLALMPGREDFLAGVRIFQAPAAHQRQLAASLNRLIDEERIDDGFSDAMRSNRLQELFLLCSRFCVFLRDQPSDIRTTDPHMLHAARFIGAHYMHPITTADIARDVGFSPNYLSRRFRQTTGVGLHEYLVFIRLHHAALELVSTRDSITTIAFRCGFSDSNYFKDAFKKKYGITPRDYRNRK